MEFEEFGFISRVNYIPHCVLPLQVAVHPEKKSLIHDESSLNVYVEKDSFKVEGCEKRFSIVSRSN